MRLVLLSCATAVFVLWAGCSTSQPSMESDTGQSLLDSLRTETVRLRDRNRTLRDSLQFYADIESGQYDRDMRSLEDRLARLTYEVQLLRDGGQTVAILSTDSLFVPGFDSLSAGGARRLKNLARHLQRTYPNRKVRIEGHTDNTPLSDSLRKRFPSKWAFSGAQATVVTRHLMTLTDLSARQFTPIGYGPSRPRASNDTPGARQRNRRIRVAVLPLPHTYSRPYQTSW